MKRTGHFPAIALVLVSASPAQAQTCRPHPLPGPPLVQSDLSNLRGSVWLGSDGLVRDKTGPTVLFPEPGTNSVEVQGRTIVLPDRIERGVVWCAASILAYPTRGGSLRFVHTETGATQDYPVPFGETWGNEMMSDGSFWYRTKRSPPSGEDVEWYRLEMDGGRTVVRLPADLILIDVHRDRALLGERQRNPAGGMRARILVVR